MKRPLPLIYVTSPTPEANAGDECVSETTTVTTSADLSITKADSADPVIGGDQLVYTITVTNDGFSDAQNVVVTDDLPAGVTLVSTSGDCDEATAVPTCTLGTMPANTQRKYMVTVTVNLDTSGIIINQASVTSSTPEQNPGDEEVEEPTTVNPSADLSITKVDHGAPVVAGNQLVYTITVMNAGPSDAQDVIVTDTLPDGVTLVSTTGCVEDPAAVPTCTLGTLAANAQQQYTVTVMVDPSTSGVITNTVEVTSSTVETQPENNTDTEPTETVDPINVIFIDGFESGDTTAW